VGQIKTVVVADTNLIISAFGWDGVPARVVDLISERKIDWVISPILFSELQRVLAYSKCRFSQEKQEHILEIVTQSCILVYPEITVTTIPNNDPDNRVLECALEAGADCIVTGDKLLRSLHPWGKIQILSPADFLKSDFANFPKNPVSHGTL
jgi:putative PIN family toxin of toxin-antitoxin system